MGPEVVGPQSSKGHEVVGQGGRNVPAVYGSGAPAARRWAPHERLLTRALHSVCIVSS